MPKPTVAEVVSLANAYYRLPGNEVGGSLHLVLDDGNVDDDEVRFCLEQAREENDTDGIYLADQLLQLSCDERWDVYRLRDRGHHRCDG